MNGYWIHVRGWGGDGGGGGGGGEGGGGGGNCQNCLTSFLIMGLLLKERICSLWEQILSF